MRVPERRLPRAAFKDDQWDAYITASPELRPQRIKRSLSDVYQ
jgi:hypothetical protein